LNGPNVTAVKSMHGSNTREVVFGNTQYSKIPATANYWSNSRMTYPGLI